MYFWDWFDQPNDGKRGWYTKRVLVALVTFVLIPVLIYLVISWDPVVGLDEDGEPIKLGMYIVLGFYWVGAYFIYKRHQAKRRLNQLLDKLLDEEEAKHLFEVAKRWRQMLRNHEFMQPGIGLTGEDRAKWFGMR